MTLVLAIAQKNGKNVMVDIKIKSIYTHLKPRKWYNDLFNKIVEDGAKRYEENIQHIACSPTPEALAEMKKLLSEKSKEEVTDQEAWDASHNLMMFASIAVSMGYKEYREKGRKKMIKEWRDRDREKDERILNTKPLKGIECPVCGSIMEYQSSELYDKGTLKEPDEKVMFFYKCPKKCKRKLIFEDGTPWISKEKNLCPVCNSERTTTVTKDNQNKMYFIYECQKCGSKQVETE